MRYLLTVGLSVLLSGCSLIGIEKTYYKKDLPTPPSEKKLSFTSKEALATGATLQNTVAAKVFYKGCKPEDADAKILYDMSYRFMGLAGVNMDFDPQDPESVKKVFAAADGALEEKDKIIHQLQVDVQRNLEEAASSKKFAKDKEAELEAQNGKWRTHLGNLWFWIWFIIIAAIVVVIGLGVAQVYTGIPWLTGLFGGIKKLFKFGKQTMVGLEAFKAEIKEKLANGADEKEKAAMSSCLETLGKHLSTFQDEDVKAFVQKQKKKLDLGTIIAKQ